MVRIAVDTGGTFTDAVMEKDGFLSFYKAPSSPEDYAIGSLASIEPWHSILPECELFVHGTTVCLNALLQGKLPKTALVTTEGFRDVVEIQRSNRTSIYDPMYRKPAPLVPRRLRFEVDERVDRNGKVVRPLDVDALHRVATQLRASDVEAVAICLINSYVFGNHEVAIEDFLRKEGFENLCKSIDLSREYREYERTCTAVLNASLMSIMSAYLDSLEDKLGALGLGREVHVMQSNGGITSAAMARQKPVQTINSGIVGGIVATATLGEALNEPNAIGTDMGGTSFDVCLIVNNSFGTLPSLDILTPKSGQGTYPIQVPTLDTHTIGAGGGSIVWIDEGGLVHVGPQSAGADPGPACYGRGGLEATVTDLNIILHRLDPEMFLGGRMKVYPELAVKALEPVARSLGTTVEEAADGALSVAVNNMANAIRTMTVDRGIDPRGFTLISAGGAGPLHAALIAEELGIPRVIVPEMPGNFAAWGMLCTDLKHDFTRTLISPLNDVDPAALTEAFREMEAEALEVLKADGVSEADCLLVRALMLRYVGQGHAMEVCIRPGKLEVADWSEVSKIYDEMHLTAYAHNAPQELKELVGIKVTGVGKVERPKLRPSPSGGEKPDPGSERPPRFVYSRGESLRCAVFDREKLRPGNRLLGPAIVEQESSTSFVLPGQAGAVDEYANLVLEWSADS